MPRARTLMNEPEQPRGSDRPDRDTPQPTLGDRMFKAAMRARTTNTVARAHRMKAFGFASFPALFIGGVVMVKIGLVPGLLVMGGIFLGVSGGALAFSELVSSSVRGATNPYGIPRARDHSKADAFLAKGDPVSALAVLDALLEEFPNDAEALIWIARIRRDDLSDPAGAIEAFRTARASGSLSTPQMRLTIREMVDLARGLGEPARVAADLARQRDAYAGTDEAEWATLELVEAKRSIKR